MMRIGWVICCAAASVACSVQPSPNIALRLSPEQAVMNAAASPTGTSGIFEFPVRATGRAGANIHLNSQLDYRDPRNLSVVIDPAVAAALRARFGSDPDTFLLRKTIAVRGTARKTKIVFVDSGRTTDKYYFQTHLHLRSAHDLTVGGERPTA